jgi:hypothetical protein
MRKTLDYDAYSTLFNVSIIAQRHDRTGEIHYRVQLIVLHRDGPPELIDCDSIYETLDEAIAGLTWITDEYYAGKFSRDY